MAQYELLLPKMGESVAEATIIKWAKQPGDVINLDDTILEIATDKVDSEVPSPVAGKLVKQLFAADDVVQVGAVIAIIEIDGGDTPSSAEPKEEKPEVSTIADNQVTQIPGVDQLAIDNSSNTPSQDFKNSDRFYSPLVKSIATQENISIAELDQIKGSGADGRVSKDDLLNYINNKGGASPVQATKSVETPAVAATAKPAAQSPKPITSVSGGDEIIEMDRMRKLIADHMVMSKQTSPHVTSFVEADVTNLVKWRDKIKKSFEQRENEKITFTPIFIEAVSKAIKDFPMINVSLN